MGQRVESYSRDHLRKISLPGNAVATLFWVLPVGSWGMGELDAFWRHFTRPGSLCHDIGLLLVRDTQCDPASTPPDTTDLAEPLLHAEGGQVSDLIPEAAHHWRDHDFRHDCRGFLLFSGAYPQPGWGVMVPVDQRLERPLGFEQLVREVILHLGYPDQLEAIQLAAQAYHLRFQAGHPPHEPRQPKDLPLMQKAVEDLDELRSILSSGGNPAEIEGCLARINRALSQAIGSESLPSDTFWAEARGKTKTIRDLAGWPVDEASALEEADARFRSLAESDQIPFLETQSPRVKAALKKLRFLRQRWPELDVSGLPEFLATTYRQALQEEVETGLASSISLLEERFQRSSGEFALETQHHKTALEEWQRRRRTAESDYRRAMPEATRAQWELGPRFLQALEAECRRRDLDASSIPWDPARMVGWKLHLADPEIGAQDLLFAANTVLDGEMQVPTNSLPTAACFHGSLFADYAYYVAITAKRMSPWVATQRLCSELLSINRLRRVLVVGEGFESSGVITKEDLSAELLESWGWKRPVGDHPRPLAGCVTSASSTALTLKSTLHETRTCLEGFLKDLTRAVFATLGWTEERTEAELAIHCPSYRRSTRGEWRHEMERLTSGGAILLLESLLPLAFSDRIDSGGTEKFCKQCRTLVNVLNQGAHDPPPPPPRAQDLEDYAGMIRAILDGVQSVVGEMPWHLSASQTFGSDPLVVTGHAWSHSHPEERLIRVMLWAGEKPSREYLVWNKTLTNPVMTDAVLL